MSEYASYVASLKARAKISRNGGCGNPEESDRSLSVLLSAQAELMDYVQENMLTRKDAETLFEIHSHSCPGSAHNAGTKPAEKTKETTAQSVENKKGSKNVIEVSRNGIKSEGLVAVIVVIAFFALLIIFAPQIGERVGSWRLK